MLRKAIDGVRTVTNDVLPQTHVDFVSYSSYDTLHVRGMDRQTALRESLDYIGTKLPAKALWPGKRVFI